MHEARVTEERSTLAAWGAFGLGLVFGLIALGGEPRPITSIATEPNVAQPTAGIAATITAASFLLSTLLHRRHETGDMPTWQRAISHVSTATLTVSFAAVAFMAVLTGSEVLALGLQGFEMPTLAGAMLAGTASAAGGWLAFQAGIELRTSNLTALLFSYLTIGTLFAMITSADPRWWQLHFSRLGSDWAFNLTLIVAGLLVAAIGLYLGRDLHRWMGDTSLGGIAWVVALFAATGIAVACVGLIPTQTVPLPHNIAAFGALGLFALTAVAVTIVLPGPPRMLMLTTLGAGVGIAVAMLLWRPVAIYNLAALEVIAVGILFVWLTTLVRTVGANTPSQSRRSTRSRLLRRPR